MKRGLTISALAMMALTTIFAVTWVRNSERAQKKLEARREAGYQVTLRMFRNNFPVGLTRMEVEERLRYLGVEFNQMQCTAPCDDLVEIGSEQPPWFCSTEKVYAAFRFARAETIAGKRTRADAMDALKEITIRHLVEGCL